MFRICSQFFKFFFYNFLIFFLEFARKSIKTYSFFELCYGVFFGLVNIQRMDIPTLAYVYEGFDAGYGAYVGFHIVRKTHTHPIALSFISLLLDLKNHKVKKNSKKSPSFYRAQVTFFSNFFLKFFTEIVSENFYKRLTGMYCIQYITTRVWGILENISWTNGKRTSTPAVWIQTLTGSFVAGKQLMKII